MVYTNSRVYDAMDDNGDVSMRIVIEGDTAEELRENILTIAESYKTVTPKRSGRSGITKSPYHTIYADEYRKIYDSMSCKDGIPLRDSGYQLKRKERLEVVKLAHANAKPIWAKDPRNKKRVKL